MPCINHARSAYNNNKKLHSPLFKNSWHAHSPLSFALSPLSHLILLLTPPNLLSPISPILSLLTFLWKKKKEGDRLRKWTGETWDKDRQAGRDSGREEDGRKEGRKTHTDLTKTGTGHGRHGIWPQPYSFLLPIPQSLPSPSPLLPQRGHGLGPLLASRQFSHELQ